MDRVSRNDAERAAERLATVLGKRWNPAPWSNVDGANVADVGSWHLDHNPTYGGCVVVEIHNAGGGESRPFGDVRRSPRDFVDAVGFALQALYMSTVEPAPPIDHVRASFAVFVGAEHVEDFERFEDAAVLAVEMSHSRPDEVTITCADGCCVLARFSQ